MLLTLALTHRKTNCNSAPSSKLTFNQRRDIVSLSGLIGNTHAPICRHQIAICLWKFIVFAITEFFSYGSDPRNEITLFNSLFAYITPCEGNGLSEHVNRVWDRVIFLLVRYRFPVSSAAVSHRFAKLFETEPSIFVLCNFNLKPLYDCVLLSIKSLNRYIIKITKHLNIFKLYMEVIYYV